MAKSKTPAVWVDKSGRKRLVWSQDDEIKAQFDGFKPEPSKKAAAPAQSTSKSTD